MTIKIGDQVRFLNSVGGGTVVRFQGKDVVLVEDADGFEVPVLARECVVVGESRPQPAASRANGAGSSRPAGTGSGKHAPEGKNAAPRNGLAGKSSAGRSGFSGIPDRSGDDFRFVAEERSGIPDPEIDPDELPYVPEEIPGGDLLNVSLAFLPAEGGVNRLTGFETYLLNESNYYLSFNYMSTSGSVWTSRAHGSIEPNTQLRIDEFTPDVLNDFARIALQFIAFKPDKPYGFKDAFSVERPLDPVKFYKQTTFGENDYFDDGAWIIPLVKNDRPEERIQVDPKELRQAMMRKVASDRKPVAPAPVRKDKQPVLLEIDLHIHQLLDSTAGMSNGDILNYQLDKFREVLEENARNKGQKIVFIHGKGDGVLRKAIERELHTRYKEYSYQDASFKEYGFGATMVTIR